MEQTLSSHGRLVSPKLLSEGNQWAVELELGGGSQSAARKPPAKPEAQLKRVGDESTRWMRLGEVLPDCER